MINTPETNEKVEILARTIYTIKKELNGHFGTNKYGI